MRPMVSSATATAFAPGVFMTTMPRRVAASASMLSTPTPARPMTRSLGAFSMRASSACTAERTTRASASARAAGKPVGQLVVRQDIPSRLGRKHGQRCRRNLLSQYDLHRVSLDLLRGFVLVKADALLLAEQIEHAHHSGMRLAFAAFVVGDGVGVDAEALGHLVLIEIELLAGDEQLFSES